jgi:hypothetical protein
MQHWWSWTRIPGRVNIHLLSKVSRPVVVSSGYPRHFPTCKATGHEADHSPWTVAKIKNKWSNNSGPTRTEKTLPFKQGPFVLLGQSTVQYRHCAYIFWVTNWFRWRTKKCPTEMSKPQYGHKQRKNPKTTVSATFSLKTWSITLCVILQVLWNPVYGRVWVCLLLKCHKHEPATSTVVPNSDTVLEKQVVLITYCHC